MGIFKKILKEVVKSALSTPSNANPAAKPAGGAANAVKPALPTPAQSRPRNPLRKPEVKLDLPKSCDKCGKTFNGKRWFCDACGARTSLAEPTSAKERDYLHSDYNCQKQAAEKKAKEYAAFDFKKDGDFTFMVSGNSAVITGYSGTSAAVAIPSQIQGLPVTGIGKNAFREKGLTSVTIPKSVTSIGDDAFSKNNISRITIPGNVATVGNAAFASNKPLTGIVIEDGVQSIGRSAFENPTRFNETESKIAHVVIPGSIKNIGEQAFARARIASVTISSGVQSIGDSAFFNNQLKSLLIPEGVTEIGELAFSENLLTEVKLPGTLQTIGKEAFNDGNKIPAVSLPAGLKSIGMSAFANNMLTELSIPDGVEIKDGAFRGNQLARIHFPANITKIEEGVFRANKLTGNFTVPETIKKIGDYAFAENQFAGVEIRGRTEVGNFAFQTNQISKLIIGNRVQKLGEHAFTFNKLVSVIIPESVQFYMKTEKKEQSFDFDVKIERGETLGLRF